MKTKEQKRIEAIDRNFNFRRSQKLPFGENKRSIVNTFNKLSINGKSQLKELNAEAYAFCL
jgi:uncharacterized membrane protein